MKIVNIKSGEKYDVYGGRPGKGFDGYWGNPHVIGHCYLMTCNCVHTREEAIEAYRKDFEYKIKHDGQFFLRVMELQGKTVGCFCVPLKCHLEVIKEYLDNFNK